MDQDRVTFVSSSVHLVSRMSTNNAHCQSAGPGGRHLHTANARVGFHCWWCGRVAVFEESVKRKSNDLMRRRDSTVHVCISKQAGSSDVTPVEPITGQDRLLAREGVGQGVGMCPCMCSFPSSLEAVCLIPVASGLPSPRRG